MAGSDGVLGGRRLVASLTAALADRRGAERPVHVIGDGGQDEPVSLVRPVAPTANPDRHPGEPGLAGPRLHLATALGGQLTD